MNTTIKPPRRLDGGEIHESVGNFSVMAYGNRAYITHEHGGVGQYYFIPRDQARRIGELLIACADEAQQRSDSSAGGGAYVDQPESAA